MTNQKPPIPTVERLVNYFGTVSEAARALSLTPNVITNWKARGYIPPSRALEVARATRWDIQPIDILTEAEALEMDRKGDLRA